jgi:hypothetical protein
MMKKSGALTAIAFVLFSGGAFAGPHNIPDSECQKMAQATKIFREMQQSGMSEDTAHGIMLLSASQAPSTPTSNAELELVQHFIHSIYNEPDLQTAPLELLQLSVYDLCLKY